MSYLAGIPRMAPCLAVTLPRLTGSGKHPGGRAGWMTPRTGQYRAERPKISRLQSSGHPLPVVFDQPRADAIGGVRGKSPKRLRGAASSPVWTAAWRA